MIIDKNIDNGKPFDWGKASLDYAKYRDIYPQEFYQKILDRKLCIKGQSILDIGTGTGVIPRNMYQYGAKWTGTDISENQIEQAKKLSKDMDIEYYAVATENIDFSEDSFDVITACQCFFILTMKKLCQSFTAYLNKTEESLFYIWRGYHLRIRLQEPVKSLC